MLDPDPYQMNTDPKHRKKSSLSYFLSFNTVDKQWVLKLQFSKNKDKFNEIFVWVKLLQCYVPLYFLVFLIFLY
jgi:hypothetical protein